MKDNIKLALFFVLLLGLFTILLCTESSRWFTASIAMIFTMSGVFVGQLIKNRRKVHFGAGVLWGLSGLFLLAIIISLSIYFLLANEQSKQIYIVLTNLVLAFGSMVYLFIFHRRKV